MAFSHHFDLQHFDQWWNESNPAHTNFSHIPTYRLGKFISDTRTYELFHDHELLAMIPAHYRNGLRFLNHDIICFQKLLQHPRPSYRPDLLQLKYEIFGRELLVLSKIREWFIQEVRSGCLADQPETWMSPIMNSFLAYMYYCGSVNPCHKSLMMNSVLDDPQTYDWYSWAEKQVVPGLWGRLPEHPEEYQAAMLQAIIAQIALEPHTESPGPCSEMWCKGMIDMMIQTRLEIESEVAVDKSEQEMPGKYMSNEAVRKARGRPKGVCNSIIVVPQMQSKSPMKLRSMNKSGCLSRLSALSISGDLVPEIPMTKDAKEMEELDQVLRLKTSPPDSLLAVATPTRKSGALADRNTLLDLASLNQAQPAKRLHVFLNKKPSEPSQTSSDFAAAAVAPSYVMELRSDYGTPSSNSPLCSEDLPYDMDVDQAVDVDSSLGHASLATPDSYPEDLPYDMDVDQAVDANSSLGHASLATPDSCLDLPGNDTSLPMASNHLEESVASIFTPPGTLLLSKDDLQMSAISSPSCSRMELERSLPIPSPSMSSSDESAQTPPITSKTSKGTLVFTKSHDTKFSYDSVTFIPTAPRSRVKSKSKSKSSSKVPIRAPPGQNNESQMLNKGKEKAKATCSKESQKSSLQERAKSKDERNMEISDESPMPHPGPSTRSKITETLPANMSKVAKSCQIAQESENRTWSDRFLTFFGYLGRDWAQSPALQNDIKLQVGKAMISRDVEKQIKNDMHVIVKYVYWMKKRRGAVKLQEQPEVGFKVLFELLQMRS
ncbi:uncharacterized protein F5147DRAFT_776337 [Suillus discolor]|uniref:Uncharacterized protein n=1 Tax=Suillus discolor TaxID=1912936 RepID=A0A9P7JRB1_9AGAM|nr:uncharacterized protein F5147DRAFT_782915 [Suillus discolor]XP_041290258.1 uncharacterized protein F5147DRAFT_776337 [Suillus discolor]KAG2083389.1 hypothetical protein F5147DRAFT_782915 [Suillus discolor]KAG2102580.1 hypothetical protein F5147DRAFT_776337 [Suillus discolor]